MFYRFNPLRGRLTQATQLAAYRSLCGLQSNGAAQKVPLPAAVKVQGPTVRPKSSSSQLTDPEMFPLITKDSNNIDLINMGNAKGYICQGYNGILEQQMKRQVFKHEGLRTFKTSQADVFFLYLLPILAVAGIVFFKTQFEAVRDEKKDAKFFGLW